jgi:type II secretion system protein G
MTDVTADDAGKARNGSAMKALVLGLVGVLLTLPLMVAFFFGHMGRPLPYVGLWLTLGAIGGCVALTALVLGFKALTRPGRKEIAIMAIVNAGLSLPVGLFAIPAWVMVFVFGFGVDRGEGVRRGETISEIFNVKTALGVFETDVGRYPTTAEGLQALVAGPPAIGATWKGPYLERSPVDGWGRELVYRCPGTFAPNSYDLFSMGPDGVAGTDDDVRKDDVY